MAAVAQYDPAVSERTSSPDPLAGLLLTLRLQPAGMTSPSEAAHAQLDLLFERVATLSKALRDADGGAIPRVAARLLLADLAMVAAQLRGHATAHSASLASALENVREILDKTGEGATPV